jgi:hypothetical protein
MTRRLIIVTGALFIVALNAVFVVALIAIGVVRDWLEGKGKRKG